MNGINDINERYTLFRGWLYTAINATASELDKMELSFSRGTLNRAGLIDCQVCVPESWDDEQVIYFTEFAYPCGTENGWQIRKAGNKGLGGDPERQPCEKRKGYVHIILDA